MSLSDQFDLPQTRSRTNSVMVQYNNNNMQFVQNNFQNKINFFNNYQQNMNFYNNNNYQFNPYYNNLNINLLNSKTYHQYNNENFPNQQKMQNNLNMKTNSYMSNKLKSIPNNIQNDAIYENSKNTSIIRVLQCFNPIFKNKIKEMQYKITTFYDHDKINDSLPFLVTKYIDKSSSPNKDFINEIKNFRKKLSLKIKDFQGQDEVPPRFVIFKFLNLMNEEYISKKISYDEYYLPLQYYTSLLPKESVANINNYINNVRERKSPFYSNFYFIFLDIFKCRKCNQIIKANDKDKDITFSHFLPIKCKENVSLSDSIKGFLIENDNGEQICNKCGSKNIFIKEKYLINNPNYLIFELEGQVKGEKIIDKTLNFEFNLRSKYNLFAIIKNDNDVYNAYVFNEGWNYYSNEIDSKKCGENFKIDNPDIVIYKRINS